MQEEKAVKKPPVKRRGTYKNIYGAAISLDGIVKIPIGGTVQLFAAEAEAINAAVPKPYLERV